MTIDNDVPKNYKSFLNSPKKEKWKEAMPEEMNSLIKNETWTLTEPPEHRKIVGSEWIYRKKKEVDGGIRYKARLVAQGFFQVPGIDFREFFHQW